MGMGAWEKVEAVGVIEEDAGGGCLTPRCIEFGSCLMGMQGGKVGEVEGRWACEGIGGAGGRRVKGEGGCKGRGVRTEGREGRGGRGRTEGGEGRGEEGRGLQEIGGKQGVHSLLREIIRVR